MVAASRPTSMPPEIPAVLHSRERLGDDIDAIDESLHC